MNKLNNCVVRNCIPTPSGCVDWDGGDIEYLGICNGTPLNTMLLEIITKLQAIAGQDLSAFDLDGLLDICALNAPEEVTLINILNLIKQNQVCLKDFINGVSKQLSDLLNQSKVTINLKCYQELDNFGNALSITRDQLDQLVINELCEHEKAIEDINGKITNLQEQINNFPTTQTVDELNFATCVDSGVKATSQQVIKVAEAHCELETATGNASNIQAALSKAPSDWNTLFNTLPNWNSAPVTEADYLGNALLIIGNLTTRITYMENNCCAMTCDDVKVGFTVVFNEDMSGIILSFNSGAGTSIPSGFTDQGSTGTITDILGNVQSFNLTISNNIDIEIPISGLDLSDDLKINITSKIGNGSLTCQKCLNKVVKSAVCKYCEITASEDVTIIYKTCN